MKNKINLLIFLITVFSSSFSFAQGIVVKNMWDLNTDGLDFSAVPYKNGLMFTSTRKNNIRSTKWFDRRINDFFMDLYYVDKISSKKAKLVFGEVNRKFHDGTAIFLNKGNKMLFSRNNQKGKNSKKEIDIKIYSADKNGDKWTNVEELPFNGDEFTTCHPAVSLDGNTLVFSSNRSGSNKMDLYLSKYDGKSWSQPIKINGSINSNYNETFPFLDSKGDLYFSSDRPNGVGGIDIYVAQSITDNEWSEPKLLPRPFNSVSDDFSFYMNIDSKSGYLSSDRPGGKGGDDIYYWESDEIKIKEEAPKVIEQELYVYDEKTKERLSMSRVEVIGMDNLKIVENFEKTSNSSGEFESSFQLGRKYELLVQKSGYLPTTINLKDKDFNGKPIGIPLTPNALTFKGRVIEKNSRNPKSNAKVILYNVKTQTEKDITTDYDGKFNIPINCDGEYEIRTVVGQTVAETVYIKPSQEDCVAGLPIEKNVLVSDAPVATYTPPVTTTYTPPVVTTSSVRVLNNIDNIEVKQGDIFRLDKLYYDYDKSFIRKDAALELNKVLNLMNKYPNMNISLGSHTDARGNDVYNQNLSQKRAEAAYQYLISKGISPSRITYSGYGENQLINDCGNGVNCDDTSHQQNRRTEITITKM